MREEIRRSVSAALEEHSARAATPAAPSGSFTPTVQQQQQQQQQRRQQIARMVELKQWDPAFQMVSPRGRGRICVVGGRVGEGCVKLVTGLGGGDLCG